MAYWLLTGQTVFTADTPSALVLQHIQATPTAPSARAELAVPAAMDRVVLSCLAKHPSDRPASARELSRQLDDVDVAGTWSESQRREWWERPGP